MLTEFRSVDNDSLRLVLGVDDCRASLSNVDMQQADLGAVQARIVAGRRSRAAETLALAMVTRTLLTPGNASYSSALNLTLDQTTRDPGNANAITIAQEKGLGLITVGIHNF